MNVALKAFCRFTFCQVGGNEAQCVCAAAFGRQVRAFNHTAALFFYFD
jgi:hypothetical protein